MPTSNRDNLKKTLLKVVLWQRNADGTEIIETEYRIGGFNRTTLSVYVAISKPR